MNLIQNLIPKTMDNSDIDKRIKFLLFKIKNNSATLPEKNEYVELLLKGGYIDQKEFYKYKNEFDKKESNSSFLETLIGIGLAVILGTLISKIFDKE